MKHLNGGDVSQTVKTNAPLKTKLLFWLIMGALSTTIAETVCLSSPFPFFTIWGVIAVIPLYTLHILALSYLVFRKGTVNLHVLFTAGAIFGMYEAYITKVIWGPTWGPDNIHFAGIAPLQTFLLIFFWHPIMAFIIPIFIAENCFTGSSETLMILPPALRNRLSDKRGASMITLIFALYCGIYQSMPAANYYIPFMVQGANCIVFSILGYFWKYRVKGAQYTFRELLPSRTQASTILVLLGLFYTIHGIYDRAEVYPRTIDGYITVWAFYVVLGLLLHYRLKTASALQPFADERIKASPLRQYAMPLCWLFQAVMTVTAFVFIAIKPVSIAILFISWIIGTYYGISSILKGIKYTNFLRIVKEL